MSRNSLLEALKFGKLFLKEKGIDTFSLDAEILLMFVLNCDRVRLFTRDTISDDETEEYKALLKRRGELTPVPYITGQQEFMSLPFFVNEHTLIPRPDTEILVETALKLINENSFKNVLDLGTGTGCISVALAHFCDDVNIIAADISDKALETAKKNAVSNNVDDRITFIKSDMFENIAHKFDIIISNPPYIKTRDIDSLGSQVKCFEPLIALDGGDDGLKFYEIIACEAAKYLTQGGMVFFEIGYDQAHDVRQILKDNNFTGIRTLQDLAGLDRVVYGIGRR